MSNIPIPADLATFTEEILNGKLHFLCSVPKSIFYRKKMALAAKPDMH